MFFNASRRVNRIAYVDEYGRLCTIAPDGKQPRSLTEVGLRFQFPTWAPNGKYLAAIGSEPGGMGVYRLRDSDGRFWSADQTELFYGQVQAPLYLYWAPDSSRLSFLVGYPQSIGLYLSPRKGQRESQLIETGQPFFWQWMPDSAYLFIHTGGMGHEARLNFIDQDGEDWGADVAAPGYFQAPAIAADGRYWAFAECDVRGRSRLVVEHHTTGDRLTLPHEGAVAMSWQPGGAHLAFITPDESAQHYFGPLHLLTAPSGAVRCVVDEQVLAFFWSPNGRYLAYFTLAASALHDGYHLALRLLDVENGRGRLLTVFRPPPFFIDEFLPIFDQYAHSHRLWSPDSDALVLPMMDNGRARVVVVTLDGACEAIATGVMPFWSQN